MYRNDSDSQIRSREICYWLLIVIVLPNVVVTTKSIGSYQMPQDIEREKTSRKKTSNFFLI